MSKDTPNFKGHFALKTRGGKKIYKKWRMPRGIDRSISSVRGPMPKVGYGHKNEEKYMHPCKLKEKLIYSKKDLEDIKENIAIRFSSSIGKKKKEELLAFAKSKKLKVLN